MKLVALLGGAMSLALADATATVAQVSTPSTITIVSGDGTVLTPPGEATADLPVAIAAANAAVPCDQGDALAAPATATTAGFSHCVLNADFTKVGGFFGNTANFIDGCGATGTKIFQAYYAYSGTPVPCNRMDIEQDSGTQVLHLQYLHGDSAATGVIRPLELAYPTLHHNGGVQSGWPQPASPGTENLPQTMYAEITFRMTASGLNQGQLGRDIPFAWWQMGGAGEPKVGGIEVDYIEINSDSNFGSGWNNSTGMRDWCTTGTCNKINQPIVTHTDYTQYHTFSVLVTSDLGATAASNFAKCLFTDGVLNGCQTISPADATGYRTDRSKFFNYDVVWVGNNGGSQGPNYESINPIDVYLKSMTIWECSTYATTNCPGTQLVNQGSLTYWH